MHPPKKVATRVSSHTLLAPGVIILAAMAVLAAAGALVRYYSRAHSTRAPPRSDGETEIPAPSLE